MLNDHAIILSLMFLQNAWRAGDRMIKTQRLQSVDIMLFDLGFHSSAKVWKTWEKISREAIMVVLVGGLRSGGQWRHASSNWLLRLRNLPFKFNLVNYHEKQTWKSFPMSGRNVPYKSYCNSHVGSGGLGFGRKVKMVLQRENLKSFLLILL